MLTRQRTMQCPEQWQLEQDMHVIESTNDEKMNAHVELRLDSNINVHKIHNYRSTFKDFFY